MSSDMIEALHEFADAVEHVSRQNDMTRARGGRGSASNASGYDGEADDVLVALSAGPRSGSDSVWGRVCPTSNGMGTLLWCDDEQLELDFTHTFRGITIITTIVTLPMLRANCGDVVTNCPLRVLLRSYCAWRNGDLREIAHAHEISIRVREPFQVLKDKLLSHDCTEFCPRLIYSFSALREARGADDVARKRGAWVSGDDTLDRSFMRVVDDTLRETIISEWQEKMTNTTFATEVCAACARCPDQGDGRIVHPDEFDLTLLRNAALPDYVLPRTYSLQVYKHALLDPAGMQDPWCLAPLRLCRVCERDLVQKERMPRLCLANWLYYGHDTLPGPVKAAFRDSSQFDRLLVARARGSRISFRFSQLLKRGRPSQHDGREWEDPTTEQRFVKGNLLVMPQNSTHLNDVLPPPPSVVRDAACAVFVGKVPPTKDTIRKLSPVLVRPSIVRTIIQFLVARNPYYLCTTRFHGFSQDNLDALLSEEDRARGVGVPCALEVGFVDEGGVTDESSSDYSSRNQIGSATPQDSGLLMESVGYTSGDDSPVAYRDMKLKALYHCLHNGRFIMSQAGERFVPDFENPSLLTWMFPHLDPWGIGGFHHPDRTAVLSMEEQLKYLLQIHDSPFQRDADFAFVYYNILQKKNVCDSVRFRVKVSQQHDIVRRLLAVDKELLQRTIANYNRDPQYEASKPEERSLLQLVSAVGAVLRHLPGTAGYRLRLRNEIRSLVHFHGTPAFFVTLNPSDINHPLVRLLSGSDINLEDAESGEPLTEWERRLLVARNPGPCARFFHTMITFFVDIILRFGRSPDGLFGMCCAYYGTVECQARGTLHCHMLIWIAGHPSPQIMRDRMSQSEQYQSDMFAWLESIIKSEFLGTDDQAVASVGEAHERPSRSETEGYIHPGTITGPLLQGMSPQEFAARYQTYVNDLVERYNWHEHTETCWKYLRRGQERVSGNCRMRMDGTTRLFTEVDEETGSILLRRLHPMIANYNDLVVFLMKCNMDIKHVGSGEGAKALIYYITDYITKAEVPAHLGLAALLYAISRTEEKLPDVSEWTRKHEQSALNIAVNSILCRTEVSHQQIMSYLVGGGDHYTSHKFRMLHIGIFEAIVTKFWSSPVTIDALPVGVPSEESAESRDAYRSDATTSQHIESVGASGDTDGAVIVQEIDPAAESEELNVEESGDNEEESVTLTLIDGSLTATSQQQDYLLRPDVEPFRSMGLYEFVGKTEKLAVSSEQARKRRRGDDTNTNGRVMGRPEQPRGNFLPTHPQHETHLVRTRVIWTVPVILGDRLARPDRGVEEREEWARTILVLFRPWRKPDELKGGTETWYDAYMRVADDIPSEHLRIIKNMSVLSECRDARDRVREERRAARDAGTYRSVRIDGEDDGTRTIEQGDVDDMQLGLEAMESDEAEGAEVDVTATLDSLITLPARVALEQAYSIIPQLGATPSLGTVAEVEPSERDRLVAQEKVMANLKRKRRPTCQESSHSREKRRRTESGRLPVVDVASLGSAGRYSISEGSSNGPSTLEGTIRQVSVEFALHGNEEQRRAFETIARHVCFGGGQLLMYIGGVGGTGKSHVVNAVLRLFELLGRRREILVSAPTGAAAILIGGYTIHSLVMLPQKLPSDITALVQVWNGVTYLIIDEVSMVGAPTMHEISTRMQRAKGMSATAEDAPFGGVNVIFTGDFGQLRPVRVPSLYKYELVSSPRLQSALSDTGRGVAALKGVFLWRLVTEVVLLKKNQRQQGDAAYADLLHRVRIGESEDAHRAGVADDYTDLQRRVVARQMSDDALVLGAFNDAPVIVGLKQTRDAINTLLLRRHAASLGSEVCSYYAQDSIRGELTSLADQARLWRLRSNQTRDVPSKLQLFPGMRVMVQENIAFSNHVVNGAIGEVRDIRYDTYNSVRVPVVVYVHIPGSGRVSEDAKEDVIPIFPVSTQFSWERSAPVAGGPAEIVKGRSLDRAIVDPASARTLQGIYVMLSRVRSFDGLGILRPFGRSRLYTRLPQELRAELARINRLDWQSKLRFDALQDQISDIP